MDYFLSQNAKADSYYMQLLECNSDNINLMNGIKEKDIQLSSKNEIIDLNSQEMELDKAQLVLMGKDLNQSNRKIARLKIGWAATTIAGVVSTGYFAIRSLVRG